MTTKTRSEKNKTASCCQVFRKRLLNALCGLIVLSALSTGLQAQDTPSPSEPRSIATPTLKSIEPPGKSYRTGQIIDYKIRVHWSQPTEDLRMNSPDVTLKNMELVGVAQETESKSSGNNVQGGVDQLLTFRFTAPKPGPAAISQLKLRWIQGNGALTNELAIPSLELVIKKPFPKLIFISALLTSLAGLLVGLAIFSIQKRKKTDEAKDIPKSLEELNLEQLSRSEKTWEVKRNPKDFLSDLTRILQQYSAQKLDWNPNQEDYNALRKKAVQKWSKSESQTLSDLFAALEYARFSGDEGGEHEFLVLYQRIYSFIEAKNIQTPEEAWKQPSNN